MVCASGSGRTAGRVWLLQLLHFLMLAGLLMLLRREIPGSILTIAGALGFFAGVAGPRFPLFFGITTVPMVLVLLGRLLFDRLTSSSPAHRVRRPKEASTFRPSAGPLGF